MSPRVAQRAASADPARPLIGHRVPADQGARQASGKLRNAKTFAAAEQQGMAEPLVFARASEQCPLRIMPR